MIGRVSSSKRIVLAFFALVLAVGGFAKADPIDDVQNLLIAADGITATGVGPTSIFVSWTDRSLVESAYRIEVARDEAGPYIQQKIAPSCYLSDRLCTFTISNLSPVADPLPYFVRVVPIITLLNEASETATVLFEGKPSEVDPAILGPRRPTNLQCNGGGDLACVNVTRVTLTWQDNSDEQEFWVMRGKGVVNPNFGTEPRARIPANVTTYSETLDEYGTLFSYKVVAIRQKTIPRLHDSPTTEQSFSDGDFPKTVVVQSAPLPPPTDPSGLSAIFTPPSTATLTWTDKEFNPAKQYIEEDGWFVEQTIPDVYGAPDWDADEASMMTRPRHEGQGTVTWVDTSIPADTSRCYRVRGYRYGPANSDYTNVACIGSPPRAPSNLVATALSNALVHLTWVDNSNAEQGFEIERCTGVCLADAPGWAKLTREADANATQYDDDEGLVGLTTYSYRAFAKNFSGRSTPSNIAVVTTLPEQVRGPGSTLRAVGGNHEITLTWDDLANDETGYRVEYEIAGGYWLTLTELPPDSRTYVDQQDLDALEERCYRVRAIKAQELSDASNRGCATTLPAEAPNGAPIDLAAQTLPPSSETGSTRLDLTWTDQASNERGFRVEYVVFSDLHCGGLNTAGARWNVLTTSPAFPGTGLVRFQATGLLPHTAYFFRVKAINQDGESAYSNESNCGQTLGPHRPVFTDPDANGALRATQCDFSLEGPADNGDHDQIVGWKFFVTSIIPNSDVAHTDTIFVGSDVPGAYETQDGTVRWLREMGVDYTITHPDNQDIWSVPYAFRKGPNYRIVAQSFGAGPNKYASQLNDVRDFKVLADCPVDPDPVGP